jgi:hypothetical protein
LQIRQKLIQVKNSEPVIHWNGGKTLTKSKVVRYKSLGRRSRDDVPYVGGVALSYLRDLLTGVVKVRIYECDHRADRQADAPDCEQSVDSQVRTDCPEVASIDVLADTLNEGLSDSVPVLIPEFRKGRDRCSLRKAISRTELLRTESQSLSSLSISWSGCPALRNSSTRPARPAYERTASASSHSGTLTTLRRSHQLSIR